MAKFKITGLNQVKKNLERLQKNVHDLHGKHSITLDELFPLEFMRLHTSFSSFQELYDASPFADIKFEDLPNTEWDDYIAHCTPFKTWKEMKVAGAKKWAAKKLMKAMS